MSTRIVCALILVFGFALPAHSQKVYAASRAVLWGGLAVDIATTEIFLSRGYREGNPILQNRAQRIAITAGTTILVDLTTRHIRKDNPRIAKTINFAVGGGKLTVGFAWNLRR